MSKEIDKSTTIADAAVTSDVILEAEIIDEPGSSVKDDKQIFGTSSP